MTVFLTEYAGPLFVYLLFALRPAFIYGDDAADAPWSLAATWVASIVDLLSHTFLQSCLLGMDVPLRQGACYAGCGRCWCNMLCGYSMM